MGGSLHPVPCRSLHPWLKVASLRWERLEFCQVFPTAAESSQPIPGWNVGDNPQVKGLMADFCSLMQQEFLHHMYSVAHVAQRFNDGLTSRLDIPTAINHFEKVLYECSNQGPQIEVGRTITQSQ